MNRSSPAPNDRGSVVRRRRERGRMGAGLEDGAGLRLVRRGPRATDLNPDGSARIPRPGRDRRRLRLDQPGQAGMVGVERAQLERPAVVTRSSRRGRGLVVRRELGANWSNVSGRPGRGTRPCCGRDGRAKGADRRRSATDRMVRPRLRRPEIRARRRRSRPRDPGCRNGKDEFALFTETSCRRGFARTRFGRRSA